MSVSGRNPRVTTMSGTILPGVKEGPTVAVTAWTSYLARFHERNPGITEDVLAEACDLEGMTPYAWLLEPARRRPGLLALDLACGSGPLQVAGPDLRWVGLDRSPGELARAAKGAPGALLRGEGSRQPFRDGTFDLVACSMALMLFDPAEAVVAEICRVLHEDGTLLLLLPGSFPLGARDRVRYSRLLAALRQLRPAYPNRLHLGRLHAHLARAGLSVLGDERRCFRYPVRDERHARRFVESLYAPGVASERVERAVRVAGSWVGSTVGIPLRRVVCARTVAVAP